jgi:hypothetical protein
MSTYARVQNNIVLDVVAFNPSEHFHPDVAQQYALVPEGTLPNAQLVNGEWVNPPPRPLPTPEQLAEIEAAQAAQVTAEEAGRVRAERNKLLSASDWTQVADAPVDKAAWATYRQELRDISAQAGFPATVVWPTQPV